MQNVTTLVYLMNKERLWLIKILKCAFQSKTANNDEVSNLT